jgi:hypothetical protein
LPAAEDHRIERRQVGAVVNGEVEQGHRETFARTRWPYRLASRFSAVEVLSFTDTYQRVSDNVVTAINGERRRIAGRAYAVGEANAADFAAASPTDVSHAKRPCRR